MKAVNSRVCIADEVVIGITPFYLTLHTHRPSTVTHVNNLKLVSNANYCTAHTGSYYVNELLARCSLGKFKPIILGIILILGGIYMYPLDHNVQCMWAWSHFTSYGVTTTITSWCTTCDDVLPQALHKIGKAYENTSSSCRI